MTNEQKYKTAKERDEAFDNYCKGHNYRNCPMVNMGTTYKCAFNWLAIEAEAAGEEVCHGK